MSQEQPDEIIDEQQQEIERLKGNLLAAHWCIGVLFKVTLASVGDDIEILVIDKIKSLSADAQNDFIVQGFDNFKNTLLDFLGDIDITDLDDAHPQ